MNKKTPPRISNGFSSCADYPPMSARRNACNETADVAVCSTRPEIASIKPFHSRRPSPVEHTRVESANQSKIASARLNSGSYCREASSWDTSGRTVIVDIAKRARPVAGPFHILWINLLDDVLAAGLRSPPSTVMLTTPSNMCSATFRVGLIQAVFRIACSSRHPECTHDFRFPCDVEIPDVQQLATFGFFRRKPARDVATVARPDRAQRSRSPPSSIGFSFKVRVSSLDRFPGQEKTNRSSF